MICPATYPQAEAGRTRAHQGRVRHGDGSLPGRGGEHAQAEGAAGRAEPGEVGQGGGAEADQHGHQLREWNGRSWTKIAQLETAIKQCEVDASSAGEQARRMLEDIGRLRDDTNSLRRAMGGASLLPQNIVNEEDCAKLATALFNSTASRLMQRDSVMARQTGSESSKKPSPPVVAQPLGASSQGQLMHPLLTAQMQHLAQLARGGTGGGSIAQQQMVAAIQKEMTKGWVGDVVRPSNLHQVWPVHAAPAFVVAPVGLGRAVVQPAAFGRRLDHGRHRGAAAQAEASAHEGLHFIGSNAAISERCGHTISRACGCARGRRACTR